jgi:translation initiation factor 1
MTKRKPAPPAPPPRPFNPALAALREHLPEGYTPPAPAPVAAPPAKVPARAVVRLERKGRGGKEATVVEKLDLPPAALAEWADRLKRSLGCGGGVEEGALVVQGDQRDRVVRWLEQRGVEKVIRG